MVHCCSALEVKMLEVSDIMTGRIATYSSWSNSTLAQNYMCDIGKECICMVIMEADAYSLKRHL